MKGSLDKIETRLCHSPPYSERRKEKFEGIILCFGLRFDFYYQQDLSHIYQ